MMPSRPALDLAQPFLPPPPLPMDVHPRACDCPACDEARGAPDLAHSLLAFAGLTAGGAIAGRLLGFVLDRLGVLAALGIG